MQALYSLVVGLLAGAIILIALGRGPAATASQPSVLGWGALTIGLFALVVGVLMMSGIPVFADARLSLALAAAAVVVGVGALVKRDRHWPTWAGLAAAVVPAGFWVFFMVAEVLWPH